MTPDTTTPSEFAPELPDYAPVPKSALGPALNDQGAQLDATAAPVIEKYTGVVAAADVFTEHTAFWVMESIRLDLGYGSWVHP
jgi:hypothetical protein